MNKLVSLGLVSMTALTLGAQSVQAAEFEANSKGYVQLNDTWEEGGIVDPETPGPEIVVPPTVEPPVGTKELALIYWPDFNFGEADYDEANGNTLFASPLEMLQPAGEERPLFVQVRSTVGTWSLSAEAGEFVNNADATNKLTGAQIIIKNVTEQQNTEAGVGSTATASALKTVTSVKNGSTMQGLDLSAGAQTIGTFNNASTTGVSRNSFLFGTDTADYKGVQLELPKGLDINTDNGNYVADLTWTLSSDAI